MRTPGPSPSGPWTRRTAPHTCAGRFFVGERLVPGCSPAVKSAESSDRINNCLQPTMAESFRPDRMHYLRRLIFIPAPSIMHKPPTPAKTPKTGLWGNCHEPNSTPPRISAAPNRSTPNPAVNVPTVEAMPSGADPFFGVLAESSFGRIRPPSTALNSEVSDKLKARTQQAWRRH